MPVKSSCNQPNQTGALSSPDPSPSRSKCHVTALKKNTLSCPDQHVMENRSNPSGEHLERDADDIRYVEGLETGVCVCFNQPAVEGGGLLALET